MSDTDTGLLPCYILHRRPFRESSLIVEVLAEGAGLFSAVLRGAQSGKKQTGAGVSAKAQVFRPLLLGLRGSGEMKNVTSIEQNGAELAFRDKYLYSGFYINELICRVWPKNLDSDELFELYRRTLTRLMDCQQQGAADNIELEKALRRFELMLLDLLGFGVDCGFCGGSGEPIAKDGDYRFAPEVGFTPLDELPDRALRNCVLKGADIHAIGQDHFDDRQTLRAAKTLTRTALQPLLGNRPLKSRELFVSTASKEQQ